MVPAPTFFVVSTLTCETCLRLEQTALTRRVCVGRVSTWNHIPFADPGSPPFSLTPACARVSLIAINRVLSWLPVLQHRCLKLGHLWTLSWLFSVSVPPLPPPSATQNSSLISRIYYTLLLDLFSPVLTLPIYECKTKGGRAFSHFGPSVWNSLPLHIRNAATIDTFKSALKTHLLNLKQFV